MDSITHLAAGALTPLVFRKAPRIWPLVFFGILMGELPDLDVFAGLSAHAIFVTHRSFTHSVGAIILFSLLFAALFRFLLGFLSYPVETVYVNEEGNAVVHRPDDWPFSQILLTSFICVAGHVYLDCMTTFGTQIFWPFSDFRVAVPALYIIDPLFTLPLLAVLVFCLRNFKDEAKQDKISRYARYALIYVLIYPLCCFGIQAGLKWELNNRYTGEEYKVSRISLSPAPLSPFIWKAVGESEHEYRLARVSLLNLLPGKAPKFEKPFSKVRNEHWSALEGGLPIFKDYRNFVTFPVLLAPNNRLGQANVLTIEDLRYAPVDEDDILHRFGRGDGYFLMQVRFRPGTNNATAWRYLSRGDDAATAPWEELEKPFYLP